MVHTTGLTPDDGVPKPEITTIILPVAGIIILLNIGGLAFALVCLIFNVLYRNKKQVKHIMYVLLKCNLL